MTPRRTGILGGSFDPIHWGHLRLALEAAKAARLDRVLLVVSKDPPHKQPDTPAAQRLEMAALGAGASGGPLEACGIELELPGKGYAAQVVAALARAYPGEAFYYLVGSDLLPTLPYWKDSAQLLALAQVLCVPRPGWRLEEGVFQRLSAACGGRVERLEIPVPEISSTQVRQRLRAGEPVEGLIPQPVLAYIQKNRLYR